MTVTLCNIESTLTNVVVSLCNGGFELSNEVAKLCNSICTLSRNLYFITETRFTVDNEYICHSVM